MRRSILLTLVAVLVTACGGSDEPTPTIDPVPDESTDESTDGEQDGAGPGAGDSGAGESDALLGAELQQVIPDAAERAGVPEDEVQITVTELVTWPDGAIGCPEPGMAYTQALVDGYRLVVEAGGTSYTYHGQDGEDPVYCEQPQEPASVR